VLCAPEAASAEVPCAEENRKTAWGDGPSLAIRVSTLSWQALYWTPLSVGLGAAFNNDGGVHGYIITELGYNVRLGVTGRTTIRLGASAGIGGFTYAINDWEPMAEGAGLILSPTMRVGFRISGHQTVGAGVRALLLPLESFRDHGGTILFFVDIGLG